MKQIRSVKSRPVFIFAGMSFLISLLYTGLEVSGYAALGHVMKGIASLFFVFTGIAAYYVGKRGEKYCLLCIAALVFGMAGDIFLGSDWKNSFLCGVAAFAAGHVIYCAAFIGISGIHKRQLVSFVLLDGVLLLYLFLMPFFEFGAMLLAVIVYCTIISFMVTAAVSMYRLRGEYPWTVSCVIIGAVLFMVSDFILVHSMFTAVVPKTLMKWLNTLTYYPGQILLALSCLCGIERTALNKQVPETK